MCPHIWCTISSQLLLIECNPHPIVPGSKSGAWAALACCTLQRFLLMTFVLHVRPYVAQGRTSYLHTINHDKWTVFLVQLTAYAIFHKVSHIFLCYTLMCSEEHNKHCLVMQPQLIEYNVGLVEIDFPYQKMIS